MQYLHTMIRVSNLDDTLHFFCDLLGLVELEPRCRPRVHRCCRRALLVEWSELSRGGVGGELPKAELRAHLALEIPIDLGHARLDLAATERADGAATGASSDDTRLAALQHVHPAAAAEAVAAREHDGAEQQLDADGAAVVRRPRRDEARSARVRVRFGASVLKLWR